MQYERNIEEIISNDNIDTIKISTLIYFFLGIIIPFWIVSIPICWFLAYKSFKSSEGTPLFKNGSLNFDLKKSSKYEDLDKLKDLLDKGALSQEEYEKEKAKILNT